MQNPATYAKAIVAATSTATGTLVTSASDGEVTMIEVIIIILSTLGAAAATWAIPNKDPEGEAQEQSTQPPEVGDPGHPATSDEDLSRLDVLDRPSEYDGPVSGHGPDQQFGIWKDGEKH